MLVTLNPSDFLNASDSLPVVDVRSPSEYRLGHIPGALNIPLFSDTEREEVGIHYVQKGRSEAILRGLDLILPSTGKLLKSARSRIAGDRMLLYCWRGGLRSQTMGWLFQSNGYQVSLLEGGYKGYRRHVRAGFGDAARVVVIGGYTGSGKTQVLNELKKLGQQVIDLEGDAGHRGSVFGGIGLPEQPTNQQFENNVFDQWRRLDPTEFIWLEDESRMIGRISLPEPLVAKIERAPLILLEIPREIRVQRLVGEYAGIDDRYLQEAVMKIETRLGKPRAKGARISIDRKDYTRVAEELLTYYDKAYLHAVERRTEQPRYPIRFERFDAGMMASRLIDFANAHLKNGSDLPGL